MNCEDCGAELDEEDERCPCCTGEPKRYCTDCGEEMSVVWEGDTCPDCEED